MRWNTAIVVCVLASAVISTASGADDPPKRPDGDEPLDSAVLGGTTEADADDQTLKMINPHLANQPRPMLMARPGSRTRRWTLDVINSHLAN